MSPVPAARSGGPATAAPPLSRRALLAGTGALVAAALAGCGTGSPAGSPSVSRLRLGAIPDQDPEVLARLHGTVADAMARALDLDVEYRPVTDYAAAVSLFRTGDLDLV